MSSEKIEYPKASSRLELAGLLVYIGGIFLTVSFFSPYWISSYDESFSPFKNMGIWEYCFENFRYPYYQYDKVFDGCRGVLSDEYYVIREWLLPGWLLALEFLISIAIICSLAGQIILAIVVIRYPLEFVLKNEHLLVQASYYAAFITSCCVFLSICIFPLNCWRRDWLQYPMFNHLSWAYYSLFIANAFHALGTYVLYGEYKFSYDKRKENRSLVMQMYPQHDRNGFY